MKRFSFVIVLLLVGVATAFVQIQDPWHRPLNPQGASAGITYGTAAPGLATTGTNPGQGEVWMDTNGASDGGPIMMVYDHVNGVWDAQLNSYTLTNNYVTKFNGIELIDSSIIDDAIDVVATGGLLTVGADVDAADSILIDGNNDSIVFEGGTADGAEITFLAVDPDTDLTITFDNPATTTSGNWMELAGALSVQDAGDTWRGIYVNLTSPGVDHAGAAVIRGIDIENNANTASGEETGLHFTAGWDAEIHFGDNTATLWWFETGNFTMQDYAGDVELILTDMPDYGAGDFTVSAMELDVEMVIMDAGDSQAGLYIDIENAVHTGGTINGIHIDGVAPQVSAERAIQIDSGWDTGIRFDNSGAFEISFAAADSGISYVDSLRFQDGGGAAVLTLRDVPAAGTANDLMELDVTLSAMDGAGDIFQGFFVDITSADHTNGSLYGVNVDLDVADAQATETAYLATGAWDYTLRQTGVVFADLPAAAVGAMVYCTNCDLASVPCASTPGPGAWAFGTSTGPRWECPW